MYPPVVLGKWYESTVPTPAQLFVRRSGSDGPARKPAAARGKAFLPDRETYLPEGNPVLPRGETSFPRGALFLPRGVLFAPRGAPLFKRERAFPAGDAPLSAKRSSVAKTRTPLGIWGVPLAGTFSPLGAANSPLGRKTSPLGAGDAPLFAENQPFSSKSAIVPVWERFPVAATIHRAPKPPAPAASPCPFAPPTPRHQTGAPTFLSARFSAARTGRKKMSALRSGGGFTAQVRRFRISDFLRLSYFELRIWPALRFLEFPPCAPLAESMSLKRCHRMGNDWW